MTSIESILSKYDASSGASTSSVPTQKKSAKTSGVESILAKYGPVESETTETPQLYTPNPLVSTAKSTTASMANAFAGQPLEDIGETVGSETLQKVGKNVRGYAENVQQANPSQINSLSDIAEKPGTAVQTAVGNVLPQLPASIGGAYAGSKAGAKIGSRFGIKGAAIGAGLGGIFGAFAPNYLQEAAEMRGKQHETGQEDKTQAYLTAVPAAGLETVSDVVMGGKLMPKAITKSAIGQALGSDALSATGSRVAHVGKQALKSAGTEGGTEYAQTYLEQLGGNQDPNTPEAREERNVSAALGAIGGGAISGTTAAVDRREPAATENAETPPAETQAATDANDLNLQPDSTAPGTPVDLGNTTAPTAEPTAEPVDTADTFENVDQPATPQEPINVPPGGFDTSEDDARDAEDFDRLDKFVKQYQSKLDLGGVPTMVGKHLRDAAMTAGIYDPKDTPDVVFTKLKAAVDALKTPKQKIDEAAQTAKDKIKQEILDQTGGNPGATSKAAIDLTDAGLTPEVQEAVEAKKQEILATEAEEQAVVPPSNVDLATGEVIEPIPDYVGMPLESLQRLKNSRSKALTPAHKAAMQAEIDRRLAEKSAPTATATADDEITELPEFTPPDTTIAENKGKNQDQTTQTTPQEVSDTPEHDEAVRQHFEANTDPADYTPASTIEGAAEATLTEQAKVSDDDIANGDYVKGLTDLHGLPIAIETPAGESRVNKANPEEKWPALKDHYGEIAGPEAADNDHVDAFINPDAAAREKNKAVFIVDQIRPAKEGVPINKADPTTWRYDEAKVMLGYGSKEEAISAYLRNYEDGWQGLGEISPVGLANFKRWLVSGKTKEPVAKKIKQSVAANAKEQAKQDKLNAKLSLVDRGSFHPAIESLANDLVEGGGIVFTEDEYGKPNGRSSSVNPEWYKDGVFDPKGPKGGKLKTPVKMVQAAVAAYKADPSGASLTFQQGAILRRLSDVAEEMARESEEEVKREAEAEQAMQEREIADFLKRAKESVSEGYANEFADMIAEEGFDSERDNAILDREIASRGNKDDYDDNIPMFSRRAPIGQTDIFASSDAERSTLQAKQGVSDYAAQKDKRRQGNGAEPAPLFSDYPGIMGQVDIDDMAESAPLPELFKSFGKFDKAPEKIIHPDAERIRYVQDNFLDLLSELDTNNKVEIKC